MKKKNAKLSVLLGAAAVSAAVAFVAISAGSSMVSAGWTTEESLAAKGMYYSDFKTMAEAAAATADVNADINREGNTVLKNDGTLPLGEGAYVSFFGASQDNIMGYGSTSKTTGLCQTVEDSLTNVGYHVNPTLLTYYENQGLSGYGDEYKDGQTDFPGAVKNSLDIYNDAGIVFLSRAGGEGSDLSTVTSEDSDAGEHANEITGKKHYLELTNEEQAMINFAKAHCSKVVVLLNTSHVMEMGTLNDDKDINAIVWVGRPGESGLIAIGEILAGKVNPSGRTVDEWPRDFTKDPTWFNFGDNAQLYAGGSSDADYTKDMYFYADGTAAGATTTAWGPGAGGFYGLDNEEGIYLGYKYYETRYKEIYDKLGIAKADAWYKENVVYPFGSGLSYTTFNFAMGGLFTDEACATALGTTVAGTQFASSSGKQAPVKSLYVPVTVTNTGSVAGKQTVQIYVTAPYTAGGIEKSFVVLGGYAKSKTLQPGASQVVTVKVNVQDFASYDYNDANKNGNKGYELDAGAYVVRAMDTSHVELSGTQTRPYDEMSFTLSDEANLVLDDYSDKAVTNVFSKENGWEDTTREGINVDGSSMSVLSRKDLGATEESAIASFPKKSSKADRTMTQAFWDRVASMELYDADNTTDLKAGDTKGGTGAEKWAVDSSTVIPSDWTQAATSATTNAIQLKDMAGVEYDNAKWTTFMNQLSWAEIKRLVQNGGYCNADIASIGKCIGLDLDDPLDLASTYNLPDEPTVAATYNVDLGRKEGICVGNMGMFSRTSGWYGPGMNTHRSPFSGRNAQYYSQDGIQGGIIAQAVVGGAESRGLLCYIKHFACNDQETDRAGDCNFTWFTEQAVRENQLKPFQMAMQEGGASGAMTACVRFGINPAMANYGLTTTLARDQWGWHGIFLTDGYTGLDRCAPVDLMIRTGNDLPLGNVARSEDGTGVGPNTYGSENITVYDKTTSAKVTISASDRRLSGTWDATLRSGKGGIKVGGVDVPTYDFTTYAAKTVNATAEESAAQYYYARTCAQRVCYATVNSQVNHNGIKMISGNSSAAQEEEFWVDWDAKTDLGTVAQGTAVSGLTIACSDSVLNGATTSYEITDGDLPDGLTLDETTGVISGTPTAKAGTYAFTAKIYADYFNTKTLNFTLALTSAFTFDGTTGKVGTAYLGYIESTTVKASTDTTIAYSIASGTLPAGLSIGTDGSIAGTPTESGTFDVIVDIQAKTTKSGGGQSGPGGNSTTTSDYMYAITITIDAAEVNPDDQTMTQAQIKALITSMTDGKLTEAQVQAIVDQATSGKMTEAQVTALIQQALAAQQPVVQDNSLAITGIVIGSVGIAAAAVAIALLFLKKKKAA
jgi:beta-glucosidase